MEKLNGARKLDCTHKHMLKYVDKNFKIHRTVCDMHRNQWDEMGYRIFISEDKKGIIYLHILGITYNRDLYSCILDEEEYQKHFENDFDTTRDFIICDSIEDAQKKLVAFCDDMDKLYEYDEDMYLWDLWEEYISYKEVKDNIDELLGHVMTKDMCEMYSSLSFAYSQEPEIERRTMVNILDSKNTKLDYEEED